jgi:hypothetical protein
MGIEIEPGQLLWIHKNYKIGLPVVLEENYSTRNRIDDRPCGVGDHDVHTSQLRATGVHGCRIAIIRGVTAT